MSYCLHGNSDRAACLTYFCAADDLQAAHGRSMESASLPGGGHYWGITFYPDCFRLYTRDLVIIPRDSMPERFRSRLERAA